MSKMSCGVLFAQQHDVREPRLDISGYAYPALVYAHLLLFVLWLGADVGVFVLGQHFRKRERWSLDQRIALLTLLVTVDMVPRSAWALMVPLSLSVVASGGWWAAAGGCLGGGDVLAVAGVGFA